MPSSKARVNSKSLTCSPRAARWAGSSSSLNSRPSLRVRKWLGLVSAGRRQRELVAAGNPQYFVRQAVAREVETVGVAGDENRYGHGLEQDGQLLGPLAFAAFAVAQGLLGPLALGDVGDEGIVVERLAVRILHQVDQQLDGHARAVLADILFLITDRPAGADAVPPVSAVRSPAIPAESASWPSQRIAVPRGCSR